MKIGYLCYSLSGVGPRVRSRNVIRTIAAQTSHKIILITSDDTAPGHPVNTHQILSKRSLLSPRTMIKTRRILREADVVHVPVNFYQLIYTRIAYDGPIVAGSGIQQEPIYRRLTSNLSICEMIETHQEIADTWSKSGVPASFVYPAIDSSRFHPYDDDQISVVKEQIGVDPNSDIVLFVGQINKFKGAHIIDNVASKLRNQGIETVVIGDGPLRDRIESNPDIIFEGFVNNEKLPKYYNAADITVVPSRTESFSIVSLESAACGTPVVTTTSKECPMSKIFRGRETYLWAKDRTSSAVVDCILWLVEDSNRYAKQVKQGFDTINELGLTMSHALDKYLRIYRRCTD